MINRKPSPLLDNKSPFEKLLGKTLDYTLLRSFRCLCFASTNTKDRTTFSPRAILCVFLGYPSGVKGYKVLDLESHSIIVSRNVVFKEKVFPFKTSDLLSKSVDMFLNTILPLPVPLHFVESTLAFDGESSQSVNDPLFLSLSLDARTHTHDNDNHNSTTHTVDDTGTHLSDVSRPKRTTRAPTYLSQYHCSLVPSITSSSCHLPRSTSSVFENHCLLVPFLFYLFSFFSNFF